MIKFMGIFAISSGLLLALGEIARNWGDWQWWPFWLVDYIASLLLAIGGYRALTMSALRWLSAAWGFVTAMSYMSFFSHLENLREAAGNHTGPIDEANLTTVIGVLLLLSFANLLLSLFLEPKRKTKPKNRAVASCNV